MQGDAGLMERKLIVTKSNAEILFNSMIKFRLALFIFFILRMNGCNSIIYIKEIIN